MAEPGKIRPAPPGYVYEVLPEAYEGKTLSELGPIKSIDLIDAELPALARPSPVSNELIRKLVFEHRLAHPMSYPMLDHVSAKIIEVTFVDGTRFQYFGSGQLRISAPNKPPIRCLLLREENYRTDRIAVPDKSKGEQAAHGKPPEAPQPPRQPTATTRPPSP
jgi:hypothetical protein